MSPDQRLGGKIMEDANSDELSAFVSSTLKAIATGVVEAQPIKMRSAHDTGVSGYTAPREIEFDIAVSAKRTGSGGGGLKVTVFGIGANAEGTIASEASTVSRIRFSVPTQYKRLKEDNVLPVKPAKGWGDD